MRGMWTLAVVLAACVAQGGLKAQAESLPRHLSALAEGLSARVLIQTGDRLADGGTFAPKNDLTAYFPHGDDAGYLLVGHEIRWGTDPLGGRFTRLELKSNQVVGGQMWVSGMHNNCAGGVTPWGTLISGEEYPQDAYPSAERDFRKASALRKAEYERVRLEPGDPKASWGWAYEINPLGGTPAGMARRLTALGRFSHESAEVVDLRTVYLTEDYEGGCLYKFVAKRPADLSEGTLWAYRRAQADWVMIQDPTNALIEARERGATRFNRLEDVKKGPDGNLYVAETGTIAVGDPYGRILRLDPRTNRMDVYLEADGKQLANPDNLLFDRLGRLLICEDQFDENLRAFGNNQVLRRENDGTLHQVMTMMKGAEPSGPSWGPQGVMFVSALAGANSAVLVITGLD